MHRWRILLVVFLLVGAALASAGFLIPTTYTANTRIVFVPKLSPFSSMEARQTAESYLADRMKTYAQIVTTNQVLQPVIDSLDLRATVPDLVNQIEVAIPADTLVINLSVKGRTAEEAASTANRIANEMSWAVASLEGSASVPESPVQVAVLQPADIPTHPSSPSLLIKLIAAAGLALIAGVFAAVMVDNFDTRVRRRRDVTASGLRYLGGIPTARDIKVQSLLKFTEQSPQLQATFHRIAIDVLSAIRGTSPLLMITSPGRGAGKTMVAANVAGALAGAGNRVAYIDADARGGRLATQVGIPQTPGITDLISGRMELDESFFQWTWGGFTVVPFGESAIDAGEMLAGEKFAELMRSLAGHFDVIIVDAPPVTDFSDAARFTKNIRNAIVVAQAANTRREELLRATGSLRHAGTEIVGVVLSRVRDEQPAPADETDRSEETSDR